MKQVVFAVLLMAMASLTGCLNEEDSPVDEKTDDSPSDTTEDNTDTTQDTTDDTKDDGLIDPVVNSNVTSPDLTEIEATLNSINNKLVAPYDSPDSANIIVNSQNDDWVAKDGNRITTSCIYVSTNYGVNFEIYDSDDRVIYLANSQYDYGATSCSGGISIDVTLGPEPVKVGLTQGVLIPGVGANAVPTTGHYYWIVTF